MTLPKPKACLFLAAFLAVAGALHALQVEPFKKDGVRTIQWDLKPGMKPADVGWPSDRVDKDLFVLDGPIDVDLTMAKDVRWKERCSYMSVSKDDMTLSTVKVYFQKESAAESVARASRLIEACGYDPMEFKEWGEAERKNPIGDRGVGSTRKVFRGKKVDIEIAIHPSFNRDKPWYVSASVVLTKYEPKKGLEEDF